jgi:hypothetical protein
MTDESRSGFHVAPRVVFGLAIVIFGLLLTAGNLGWIYPREVRDYWPLLIAAVGLSKLTDPSARSSHGRWFGGLLVVLGLWWTADNVYDIRFHFWQWWPLALVALGIMMVLRARETGSMPASRGDASGLGGGAGAATFDGSAPGSAPAAAAGGLPGDDTITAFAFWSGCRRRSTSPTFRRADATAVMGGIEIDLRQAGTATGEAVLDVFVIWGGVMVRVPPDWTVSNEVVPIMGGTDDRSSGTQLARHRLIVRGVVIMGGVNIRT